MHVCSGQKILPATDLICIGDNLADQVPTHECISKGEGRRRPTLEAAFVVELRVVRVVVADVYLEPMDLPGA